MHSISTYLSKETVDTATATEINYQQGRKSIHQQQHSSRSAINKKKMDRGTATRWASSCRDLSVLQVTNYHPHASA
jgi:hypothetical protein